MHCLEAEVRTMRAFIQRHAALSYFLLTFAISWGGILLIVGPGDILASSEEFLSYNWVPPLVLGPTTAGLVMTALAAGSRGLREFRARLFKWRVGAIWFAVALLTAPLYSLVTDLVLSSFSPEFRPSILSAPDKATALVQGMVIALSAGIFEELGWTGFATPTLRRRHGPLATGLILGLAWGLWHVLPEILGARAMDYVSCLPLQLLMVIVGLTGYRILMVLVYDRTGSLLIGILMHTGLTASLMLLQPSVTGPALMTVGSILNVVPWLIVATLALIKHGDWSAPATPRSAH